VNYSLSPIPGGQAYSSHLFLLKVKHSNNPFRISTTLSVFYGSTPRSTVGQHSLSDWALISKNTYLFQVSSFSGEQALYNAFFASSKPNNAVINNNVILKITRWNKNTQEVKIRRTH
jgi:hypothetical protein